MDTVLEETVIYLTRSFLSVEVHEALCLKRYDELKYCLLGGHVLYGTHPGMNTDFNKRRLPAKILLETEEISKGTCRDPGRGSRA